MTNTADSGPGSLRCAIDLANSTSGANTIDFDSSVFSTPQTINLTGGQLELTNTSGTQTIDDPAASLTVSGGGLSRVFQIDANVTASISGLTITEGSVSGAGGGLVNYGGTVTLYNCTISGNQPRNGGGLATYGGGSRTHADGNARRSTTAHVSCQLRNPRRRRRVRLRWPDDHEQRRGQRKLGLERWRLLHFLRHEHAQ